MGELLDVAGLCNRGRQDLKTGLAQGYAGWFVLDARLLLFSIGFSLLFTLGTVSLLSKGRERHEIVRLGWRFFLSSLVLNIVLMNLVFDYPVFRIESFFAFP